MASHTLPLQLPAELQPAYSKRTPVPVHAAFASTRDLLAVLWEPAVLQVFDLQTRLGPGRGKVMDPVLAWSGPLPPKSYRQVAFTAARGPEDIRVAVLGSDPAGDAVDVVSVIDISGKEVVQTTDVAFVAQNGRLIPSKGIAWEAPDGKIFEGQLSSLSAVTEG